MALLAISTPVVCPAIGDHLIGTIPRRTFSPHYKLRILQEADAYAHEFTRNENYTAAAFAFAEAAVHYSFDAELQVNLGYVLLQEGYLVVSLDHLAMSLAIAPKRIAAWFIPGETALLMQYETVAADAFKLACVCSQNRGKTLHYLQNDKYCPSAPVIERATDKAVDFCLSYWVRHGLQDD